MYQTTLIPTDGSDASFGAAEDAVEITTSDGTIHVLGVIEELPMYSRSGKPKFDDEDAERRVHLEEAVGQVEDLVDTAGIDCVTAIEEGVPSREIVAYAEEINADAIVLGKRGLSDAANDLLGSTTERVIRNASTTVVSVPASD